MCYKFFVAWTFLQIAQLTNCYTEFKSNPRIESVNGNLVIVGAQDRNISLTTHGQGVVVVNDVNIVDITAKAHAASTLVDNLRTGILKDLSTDVKRISKIVEGAQGLEGKIENIQLTNATGGDSTLLRQTRQRLNALRRRVSRMDSRLTSIYHLLETDECSSNPCRNGGRCQDLYNTFMCFCLNTWEGPICDSDVNECSRYAGTDLGCQNGATCVNKPGSYECVCPPGWYGIHCTRRTQDCDSASAHELCGHGVCVTQKNIHGYTCICEQGWKTDGSRPTCTVDVDECTTGRFPCSANPLVSCMNLPGSFMCGPCPAGYTGSGFHCTDLDECLRNNGGCSTMPAVTCTNVPGSRICGPCPPGFVGDGTVCTQSESGICSINNGGCSPIATCISNPQISATYVQCRCPPNYIGNGLGPDGCQGSSSPIATVTACSSNPCGEHGTCSIKSGDTYTCKCDSYFIGPRCDTLDKCALIEEPCKNGGTCVNVDGSYKCECSKDYEGTRCETEKEDCGGVLSDESGILRYPSTNSTSYKHGSSCAWVIQVPGDKVLNLTFIKFHLEGGPSCPYDWLQIHDGRNSAAHLIGRFCGNLIPHNHILSTHNKVYLWFRSDHDVAHSGFAISWKAQDPSCMTILESASHGTIKSPGSPGNYPPNRDCYWIILAPLGKRIQFQFYTLMVGNNPNCSYDYLQIYAGYSEQDVVIGKYCNTSHPEPFLTPGPEALVHFHSDGSDSYPGFQLTYSVVEGYPGCGGVYMAPIGEFTPPTLDGKYLPNLVCEYQIKLATGSRIKIRFLELDLEKSDSCKFDVIEIRDGARPKGLTAASTSDAGGLVGKYCGTTIPPPWTSSGHEVNILFKSDWTFFGKGFRIKYEVVCGDTFTTTTGVITSPGFPNPYTDNQNCVYSVHVPATNAIKLTFLQFDVDNRTIAGKCRSDYLGVWDGDSENSTLIGKYCGSKSNVPMSITSTHNYLHLTFISDGIVHGKGFLLNYTTLPLGCGGILKETIGIVQSPGSTSSSGQYPINQFCKWVISAPPGFVVQLNWVTFSLEKSFNCTADFLAVYDTVTGAPTSPLIGRYCGQKLPPLIISTENILTLEFRSDRSRTFDGFIANYVMRDERHVCGRPFFATTGTIRSPGYPQGYPRSKDCVWTIEVPVGQQIMLNVTDFEMESHRHCNFDFLEIRNGGYETSPLIGKFCGKNILKMIPSLSNQMYLRLRTDASRSAKGFEITWDGTTSGCGGTLAASSGHITSPLYPQPYARNSECYWKIITSAGSKIQVVFFDLDLENNPLCRLDYVELHNGLQLTNDPIGRYCNDQHPPVINSKKNQMLIKFRSDVSYEGRGFNMRYSLVCNNILTGHRGVIESPNYPNNYPHQQNCTWVISVPKGNKVNITFSHFDLEQLNRRKPNCEGDRVEIREGEEPEVPTELIGTYCGDQTPEPYTSATNNLFIRFITDNMVVASGFRLEWVIHGCGGELTNSIGKISTPGYPKQYPTSTTCEWLINVDYSTSIELTITDIDIENLNNCMFDYLQIFGGPDDTSVSVGKYCHTSNQTIVLTSSGNMMFIRFKSDASFEGRGFKASYRTVPINCGGKMTAPSGIIQSRNYPKNYDNNDECFWYIEVPPSYLINLVFDDFDLEAHKNCSQDYIKVFDGNTTESPLILQHCGSTLPSPPNITSSSNTLLVHMKTDGLYASKGFKAEYSIACGRHFKTETTGLINLHEYIRGMMHCSWTIEAPDPRGHVSLTITNLALNSDLDFFNEEKRLSVYNGLDSSAPLVANFADDKIPPTIVSAGPALHVELISEANTKFTATFSTFSTACGGALIANRGEFGSLGYPNSYPANADCVWTIQPSLGNKVVLRFISLDLEESEHCNSDYIEVRANALPTGDLLGVYCGNTLPTNVTKASSLWIRFRSDNIGTGKGFLAYYELEYGNDIVGSKGRIQSPWYPSTYWRPNTLNWRVTTPQNTIIRVVFLDFTMPSFSDSDEFCFDAGVKIYDGPNADSRTLMQACTNRIPSSVLSTSNVIYINYEGSSFGSGSKFDIEWDALPKGRTVRPTTKPRQVEGCPSNAQIDLSSGDTYNLTSPGYPTGYAARLSCRWVFTTTAYEHLRLEFLDMALETTDRCMSDSVSVFSSSSASLNNGYTKLGQYCQPNATREVMLHAGNMLAVEFKTNGYRNKTGFKAIIETVCGGHLTDPNGVIQMNQTDFSRYTTECRWNITVRLGRRIKIKIEDFNSTSETSCTTYIMLRNGILDDSPLLGLGKYCSRLKALKDIPETSGNQASIKYVYSHNRMAKSFRIRYKSVSQSCGDSLTLTHWYTSANLSSPHYPEIPEPHTECEWLIRAPPSESVSIDFIGRFDLYQSKDCKISGVELRDGATENSPLIGVFCGTTIPDSRKSTGNLMYVRFYTHAKDPKNGFAAQVKIATCGGMIRSFDGVLNSPNFPVSGSLTRDLNCTWQLIGDVDRGLDLSFKVLNMPRAVNCSRVAHVSISEMRPINGTWVTSSLGVFCGSSEKNQTIRAFGNQVEVTLNTVGKTWSTYKGFSLNFVSTEDVCGGELSGPEGIVTSPGYPIMQSRNRVCEWGITVPEGRRVKLEFVDLDFHETSERYDEGIGFFNNKHYQNSISYINVGDAASVVRSSNNFMLIYFWSINKAGNRGFKAKWTSDEPSVCEGSLKNDQGIIRTPTEVGNDTGYYCQWTHVANSPQTLAIDIKTENFPTRPYSNCKHALTRIIVTDESDENFIDSVCKNSQPHKIVRSPFPKTFLQVSQSRSSSSTIMNFTAKYKVHNCGGVLNEPGEISSPGFPHTSSENVECAWLILFAEGQTIRLTFDTLDMDVSCTNEFLAIKNGPRTTSPTIGTYCGNSPPPVIQTQGHAVWIDYHSAAQTGNTTRKGFKLRMEAVQDGCGGIFHQGEMNITSPNYPNDYPANAECVWEVRVDVGRHIGLTFIDAFQLEQSDNCSHDFIEVWDNVDGEWISQGRTCGRSLRTFNSTSNLMKIMFRSDGQINGRGFKARWNLNCGGTFYASSQIRTITSPAYPRAYANNLNCNYTILADRNSIKVKFTDFVLESGMRTCGYDNVTIVSFPSRKYLPVVQFYCGNKSPGVFQSREKVIINFQTDKWITRKGFSFTYNTVECGGIITEPTTISSPIDEGTQRYSHEVNCYWNVTAPKDRVIVVRLSKFDLEYSSTCRYDYLSIFDGTNTTISSRLALLCGVLKHPFPVLRSTSNHMLLYMHTDMSKSYDGFEAQIMFALGPESGCGGSISLTPQNASMQFNLASVSDKNIYKPFLDCHWVFKAPTGYIVQITFESFHVAPCVANTSASNNTCDCDFLEVNDGSGSFSTPMLHYCGHTNPHPLSSSQNYLWVRFASDGSTETRSTGIQATIKMIPSICGENILYVTNETQSITSPNFPANYPPNTRCHWLLRSPDRYRRFDLHFESLSLEYPAETGMCSRDRLEIFDQLDGPTFISEGLGGNVINGGRSKIPIFLGSRIPITKSIFCGTGLPMDYYSGGNQVSVVFTSNEATEKQGFKLNYQLAGCNRNFTGVQGRILVGGMLSTDCLITITAPKNKTISLYFLTFILFDTGSCNQSALEIRDGLWLNGAILGRYCGIRAPSPIFSTGNTLSLHSINKRFHPMDQFDITYTTTDQGRGCGGRLYNYGGKVTSPMYPGPYRQEKTCHWEISTPITTQIVLKFNVLDFGSKLTCETDFLEILTVNGMTGEIQRHSKFCGDDRVTHLTFDTSRITLAYTSSLNNAGTGWDLTFFAKDSTQNL